MIYAADIDGIYHQNIQLRHYCVETELGLLKPAYLLNLVLYSNYSWCVCCRSLLKSSVVAFK